MTNKIVAVQGNHPSTLNPVTDTSVFLANEIQHKYKIFYYDPKNLSIINKKVLAKGFFIKFNYQNKKFYKIIKEQTLDLTKCKFILIRQDPPFNLEYISTTYILDFIKNTGDELYLEISSPIIESIFFKNSPLHDGAVIIDGNFITAARIILPISENKNIDSSLGLRHRAAIGITEKTDSIAIVVSEEKGKINFIKNGEIFNHKNEQNLKTMIEAELV